MARKAAKRKGGRPKGLAQTKKAISKIKAGMKAYWASPAGKARKKAMSKASGGGRKKASTRKTSTRKTTTPKKAWAAPKVTTRRGRPPGSKNKAKTTKAKAPVASRSRKRRSPMA